MSRAQATILTNIRLIEAPETQRVSHAIPLLLKTIAGLAMPSRRSC